MEQNTESKFLDSFLFQDLLYTCYSNQDNLIISKRKNKSISGIEGPRNR